MTNLQCPFCSPQIKDHIFLESGSMMAIYNQAPILRGHSMVVPRRHIETINELTNEELTNFFKFSREVTNLLITIFDADGFDWSLQESEAAGQSVSHLHMHIIPRKTGDLKRPGDWYAQLENQRNTMIDSSDRKHLSNEEIKNMVSFIKMKIA